MVVCSSLLYSCAPLRFGNYINTPLTQEQYHVLAQGCVNFIAKEYPPAKTRIAIKNPAKGYFGDELINLLRHAGFAVEEYSRAANRATSNNYDVEVKLVRNKNATTTTIPLNYILDTVSGSNMIRVQMLLGSTSVARPYFLGDDGSLYPCGKWVQEL